MHLQSRVLRVILQTVVPLDNWIPDKIMQYIAEENNLSETAFLFAMGRITISDGLLQKKRLICVGMQL